MQQGLPQTDPQGRAWIARGALLVVIAATAYLFAITGRFDATDVNDTPGYRNFSFASRDVLTSVRTPGYPLFLRGVELISTAPRAVPIAQFTLFAASVLLFFEALRCVTARIWLPLLAAASLMSTSMLDSYVNTIATETLSAAISILCGSLILFWSHSQRWWLLVAIMLSTAVAWLIRPNGVFLVLWIPYIGAWLVAWYSRHGAARSSARPHVRPGLAFAQLSLAVIVPLGAWIGVRAANYGHWGVACFDGYNMIGLVGQFVTPETAQSLSPEQQQVVEAALANRERRFKDGGHYITEPPLHYLRMEFNHDDTIWVEFVPPARKVAGDSPLEINAFLSGLSRSIIARQPADYATWVGKATRQAVRKVFFDLLQHPVSLSLLLASIVLFLTAPVRASLVADANTSLAMVRLMAVFAISYAVLNLVCTIPFVPPRERMTDAAALWAPSLLATWFGSLLERRIRA